MRRRLILLSLVFTLPASFAQAVPHLIGADNVQKDRISEGGVVSHGSEKTPRYTISEGADGGDARDSPQSTDVPRVRDHLNALVEASVSDSDKQLSNLAFLKTHKTGSTTLSSLFYRYGVRHKLKVAKYDNGRPTIGDPLPIKRAFPKILEECDGRVDIMHYHVGRSWDLGCPWKVAAEQYKSIMMDPDNINFVTIFREPRSHFLSYYYFFVSRNVGHKPIEKFLLEPPGAGGKFWSAMHNPVAGELGITSQQRLEEFLENDLPKFKLVLLTDRFDEGLMLLRRLFGWHLIDMSYISLNEFDSTKVIKTRVADGYHMSYNELSIQAQNKLDELTSMDRAIYEAGRMHFEKTLAPLALQVEADLVKFNSLQELVDQYFKTNLSSLAKDMYAYEDFFRYFPPASPF